MKFDDLSPAQKRRILEAGEGVRADQLEMKVRDLAEKEIRKEAEKKVKEYLRKNKAKIAAKMQADIQKEINSRMNEFAKHTVNTIIRRCSYY